MLMTKPATTPVDIPDDATIWRYMDLAKFVSVAFSGKLWFPRLSELWLADPWEGFARAKGRKRPSRVLPKGVPLNVDVAAALYAEFSGYAAETIRNAYKHVYASSWCMGAESLGMWERYGAGARGVAIESNVGRFKRALKREVRSEQYAFGGVRYHADLRALKRDFTKGAVPASSKLWRSALEVGFNKRAFYTDENEWRAAVFQGQPLREVIGLGLPMDLNVLIETVRTGPRADVPTKYAVAQVMAETGLTMPVEESGILKPPSVRRSR